MSDINIEMRDMAIKFKEECTRKGFVCVLALADGEGHGEFRHNISDVDYSMLSIDENEGKILFKCRMKSEPKKTDKTVNAIANIAEILKMATGTFLFIYDKIKNEIDIEEDEMKHVGK